MRLAVVGSPLHLVSQVIAVPTTNSTIKKAVSLQIAFRNHEGKLMLLNERVEWGSSCLGGWFCRCTTVVKSGMTFCDDMKSSCCQIILVTEGGRHWWINNHCNYSSDSGRIFTD